METMLKKMSIGWRLGMGFGLILLFIVILGVFSMGRMSMLAELTRKLYRHPYAVTQAVQDADINILKIHRAMKDIAHTGDRDRIEALLKGVDESEQRVYADFDIIRERFLGDARLYEAPLEAFRAWRPIRQEVVARILDGDSKAAYALTRGHGADQVGLITERMRALIDFAAGKSITFLENAEAEKTRIYWVTAVMLGSIVILGFAVAFLTTRSITRPIARIVSTARSIAAGELRQDRLRVESDDEMGVLAQHFNAMLDTLSQIAQQAELMAADRLDHLRLDTVIKGDLGKAFAHMVEKMQWVAAQAGLIAAGELENPELKDQSSGTLGGAMAQMVRNLRRQTAELQRLRQDAELRAAEAQRQSRDAEAQRRQVLEVASGVSDSSKALALAAEQLAASASALSRGSKRQGILIGGTAVAIEKLEAAAKVVDGNAEQVTQLVGENSAALARLASSINRVVENAEQMNQAVGSNSSAIKELAASIQAQAQNAEQLDSTARHAIQTAQKGSQVVHRAIEGMSRISERVRSSAHTVDELGSSSKQVSSIVAVIKDIADQTNLLALNAAIEAARAGEQGRGFAVVAEEVRNLAERTSRATQEIDATIGKIQSEIHDVVSSMRTGMEEAEKSTELATRSGEALEQIGQGVNQVNELIEHLSAKTREQAAMSDQIVSSTTQMSELVQQVTKAMNEQSSSVGEVSHSSGEIQQLVEQVTKAMNEQTTTISSVSVSMEEIHQVTQAGQNSIGEMSRATEALANQAEELKELALRFENGGKRSAVGNGRTNPESAEPGGRLLGHRL